MGIILSSFMGCGKSYLMNTHGNKAKMYDASDINKENIVDEVMSIVDDYDIVFIGSDSMTRTLFDEANIDYDVFYPSEDRKNEMLENLVRKRVKPSDIMTYDRNFKSEITAIDESESANCYKHKLSNFGEYIGNSTVIMQYINSLKQNENKNE